MAAKNTQKRLQLATFGFMQYLDERHFDWLPAEKQQFFTDSETILKRICFRIHLGLQTAGATGDALEFEFAGIEHNKDTDLIWDERVQAEVVEPIDPHIHGVVSLKSKRDISVIATWIGLKEEYIEAPKKGRYGKENMLAYLIHAKQPSKYQYNPQDVKTFGTFDYMAYWRGKKPAWDRQRAKVQVSDNKVSAHWLVKQVQQGKLSKKDIMRNPDYKEIYADNMVLINDAVRFYGEMKGYETLDALENGEFELSVIFVTGAPGSGKTTFALEQMKRLEVENGWRSYQASATNPLDEYSGEEIVLLDDLRAHSMGGNAWLHMLDARTSANMDARYKGKGKAFRVIIISSYLEPYEFFSYVKGEGGANEALDQFIRRIMMNIRVHRLDNSGRYVEIEAIGRTPEVIYDLHRNKFMVPDGTLTFENGLPDFTKGGKYESHIMGMAQNNREFKVLNYAGYPIFSGDADSAGKVIRDVVNLKNDSSIDHSKSERPTVGNPFLLTGTNKELMANKNDDDSTE